MTVSIARCPEHGLHGERTECFICGGPVEQVEMVPVSVVLPFFALYLQTNEGSVDGHEMVAAELVLAQALGIDLS